MIRSPSLSAEWISLVGRWGVHIMSLFCFSFSLRSYFSICFISSFSSLTVPSPSLLLSFLLRLLISLYILSHWSFFHSAICFLHRTLSLANCFDSADPASVLLCFSSVMTLRKPCIVVDWTRSRSSAFATLTSQQILWICYRQHKASVLSFFRLLQRVD